MWTCPKCGATMEDAFDACWQCGTSIEGVEDPTFVRADDAPPIVDPNDYLRLDPGKDLLNDELDELPAPPLELVACYVTNSTTEAKFVLDQLANEGIVAALENSNHGGYGITPARVVIRAKDVPRAHLWVEQYKERRKARAF
jgi:hypothetical protein